MTEKDLYHDIRPHFDHDVNSVLSDLSKKPEFQALCNYFYPEVSMGDLKQRFGTIHSADDFKKKFVYGGINNVINREGINISMHGLEKLEKGKPYLYVSNHRDILLDTVLLNYILAKYDRKLCQIAVGSNLLNIPWVSDLVRINKSFIVHRNVPTRQLYDYSNRLSSYIRSVITGKNESVWIAQREGRSKDGNDQTQVSVLKMFAMSSAEDVYENLKELNIVPVAFSYEYDPSDIMKAIETHEARTQQAKNKPATELKDMIGGVLEKNTKVHVGIGKPMNSFLDELPVEGNKNNLFKAFAQKIDEEIHQNFMLWEHNYIAYDLKSGEAKMAHKYTQRAKEEFVHYLEQRTSSYSDPQAILSSLIDIYANPVINRLHDKQEQNSY
ncbi:MAG: 1-acyl-sn-glycerol-3-phosphate acyltransferase [Cyclobacteriaceae bacterium]|nr:1-acyl-sn-glycerol-3-phosphate acyltransferase [Cyclobacteriaceae bacterium]MCH8514930.1 1-acyl-sn-glycerol-3-phosphate acyltransferase [Cyclobacteriaceae bacterium]